MRKRLKFFVQAGATCANRTVWWRHHYVSGDQGPHDRTLNADDATGNPEVCARYATSDLRCHGGLIQFSPAYSWEVRARASGRTLTADVTPHLLHSSCPHTRLFSLSWSRLVFCAVGLLLLRGGQHPCRQQCKLEHTFV